MRDIKFKIILTIEGKIYSKIISLEDIGNEAQGLFEEFRKEVIKKHYGKDFEDLDYFDYTEDIREFSGFKDCHGREIFECDEVKLFPKKLAIPENSFIIKQVNGCWNIVHSKLNTKMIPLYGMENEVELINIL